MTRTISWTRVAAPLVLAASLAGGCISGLPADLTQGHIPARVDGDTAYETMDDVPSSGHADETVQQNAERPARTENLPEAADEQRQRQDLERRSEDRELDPFGGHATWDGDREGQRPPDEATADDASAPIRIEILPEEADQQREQQALELNAGGSGFDLLTDDHEPNGGLYEIWEWEDGELVTLDSVETFLD